MGHNELVAEIRAATDRVFSTMLGMEITPGEPAQESGGPAPAAGVVAFVGLAGRWTGAGMVSCTVPLACRISTRLLLSPFQSLGDEVLDVIGELANMIIGNIKTNLEDTLGPMGLSMPFVIYGRNFTTRSLSRSQWTVFPFVCEGEKMCVQLCLAPGRQPLHQARPGVASMDQTSR